MPGAEESGQSSPSPRAGGESLCRITLLGALQAQQGGRVITRFRTYKTAVLLAALAFHADRPLPRERLIEQLWPDSDPDAGRNSLSKALSSLRNQLEPPGVAAGAIIVADRAQVRLNPAAVTTDVAAFLRAMKTAARQREDSAAVPWLVEAVGGYGGELLPGFYEDWVLQERPPLTEMYLRALGRLITHFESRDLPRALGYARQAVAADPFREEAQLALIRLLFAGGEAAAARRQYQDWERLLKKELDMPPPEEARALIRSAPSAVPAPAVPAPRPAPRSPAALPSGTVTLLRAQGAAAALPESVRRHGGVPLDTPGDGDQAWTAVFGRATDAAACAVAAQRAAAGTARIALHTGEVGAQGAAALSDTHPFFDTRAAGLLLVARAGQILCSEVTAALLRRDWEPGVGLRDLGPYYLPGEAHPERLFAVAYAGSPPQALAAPDARPGYQDALPLPVTRFFGRAAEIARLRQWVERARAPSAEAPTRLVTLTGPGGTGKTRLALETARQLLDDFRGAVWFVPLADVFDPRLIVEAVADALGLTRSGRQDVTGQVVEALARQPGLLVLDNFEQLLSLTPAPGADAPPGGESARVVETLLARAPALTCLVTSRHRLGVAGEREFPVPPLPAPSGPAAPERLTEFESIQLFVDRAQAVRPDFQVTAGNAAAVAALCARLEGIPLAIELAAARAQVLTPAQMLRQLERRFDFLVSRERNALLRHRTLRAAIEWSYQLLTSDLRAFLGALSVFRGGWTLEAAEAVSDDPLALDHLAQLIECSLVIADEADESGGMRFRQLESLREYAAQTLTEEQEIRYKGRHARHFLTVAEEAAPALAGPDQGLWLTRLEADHDNFRAALDWCRADLGEREAGLRLGAALWRFWYIRGHFGEGKERLTALLAAAEDEAVPDAVRAGALLAVGRLARAQADYGAAGRALRQALDLFRALADPPGVAQALSQLGLVIYYQDADYPAARALCEEALAIFRALGDRQGTAETLNSLAIAASDQGDYVQARALFEESLALRRQIADQQGIATALFNLGNVALIQGRVAPARALLEESLALRRALGDRWGVAAILNSLGVIAVDQRDYGAALPLLEEGLTVFRAMGERDGVATALKNLGDAHLGRADFGPAQATYRESLDIRAQMADKAGIAFTLEGLAHLAFRRGQTDRALRLWAAAEALRERIASPAPPTDREKYDPLIAQARAATDPAASDAAWAAGRALTLEEAISFARAEPPS